jgi:hypothetical protein
VYRMVKSLSGEDDSRGLVDPLKFLDITLKEKYLKRIQELELKHNEKLDYNIERINQGIGIISASFDFTDEKLEVIREIQDFWDDKENRTYSMNIRGFMLFIYSIYFKYKVHDRKDRISEIIKNPTIVDKFQFLRYWQDFQEAGFDVFGELQSLAGEVQYDILNPNISNSRLTLKVVEGYYISINSYFHHLEYGRMLNPDKWHEQFRRAVELQSWQKLKELNLSLLRIQKELTNDQIAYLDREYERHTRFEP